MNREEQLRLVHQRGHLALHEFRALTIARERDILAMMASRLDQGFDVFGVSGFRQTPYEIIQNGLEEGADGGNYMLMHWWRLKNAHLFQ